MAHTPEIPEHLLPRGLDDHDRIRDPRYQIALRDQTIAALRADLAARTEELAMARKALRVLWAYVNKHCGDWYLRADRRAIATMIEGPGGALDGTP